MRGGDTYSVFRFRAIPFYTLQGFLLAVRRRTATLTEPRLVGGAAAWPVSPPEPSPGGNAMKAAWALLAVAVVCVLVAGLNAADQKDQKEVTLKGTILCAKCELKEKDVTKCTTAIQVKENGKDVTYYLKDKGNSETYHEDVCGGGKKEGTVTGVVSEKDG